MNPTLIDSFFIYLRNTKYYLILVSAANRYITIREVFMEKMLQRNNIFYIVMLKYFRFILFYRYYCQELSKRINFQWLYVVCLFLSLYLSAVHLAWFGWGFILLILRFEFSFSVIHRFYKSRTFLIPQHFPDSQNPKRRMHKAAQQLAEAMQQNPMVSGALVGAGGFIAWKYIDYKAAVEARETARETTKATIEAEDRRHKEALATEAAQRQRDRDSASLNAQKDRDNASLNAQKDRDNEAIQRQKDRDDAYRMHKENLEAEDRRHRETLEIENQAHRETRMENIEYSKPATSEVIESSLTVD